MLNLAEKVFTGLVSIAMVMFSSYEGNNAEFSKILINHNPENIRIRTVLVNAFENDFEQIFRSGTPIIINYNFQVKKEDTIIAVKTYKNSVVFDPMNRFFQVNAEAANHHTFVHSLEELIPLLSEVDIFFDHWNVTGTYHFELSADMEKVYLSSLDREFDLLLLWNLKAPVATFEYTVERYES